MYDDTASVATFRTTTTAMGRRLRRTPGEVAAEQAARLAKRELGRSVVRQRAVYDTTMPAEWLMEDLMSNAARIVTLADYNCVGAFADREALQFAAALRNNTSVVTVTMRSLAVTELSLVPVFESLRRHRSVRCIDLGDTGVTPKALRALVEAVRRNTNIVSVFLGGTGADEDDDALVDEAVWHNQMRLPDPTLNPYDNALVTLGTKGGGDDVDDEDDDEVREVAERFQREAGLLSRPVCAHYLKGRCSYGSRCRHQHPDRRGPGGELRVVGDGEAASLQMVEAADPEPVVDRCAPDTDAPLSAEYSLSAAAVKRRLLRAESRHRAARWYRAAAAAGAGVAVVVGAVFYKRWK